jgi:hypothetical protein
MQKYAEVCEVGGVSFAAFNIGSDFQNCIDGLVIVDTTMVKQKKTQTIFSNLIVLIRINRCQNNVKLTLCDTGFHLEGNVVKDVRTGYVDCHYYLPCE